MMDDARLIETIQNYRIIYAKGLSVYRRTDFKENAWKSVAEQMNATVEECKCRWGVLRDRFTKLTRQQEIATRSGAGADTGVNWDLYKSMLFLKDHIRRSKLETTSNFSIAATSQSSSSSEDTMEFSWLSATPIIIEEDVSLDQEETDTTISLPSLSLDGSVTSPESRPTSGAAKRPHKDERAGDDSFFAQLKDVIGSIPKPTSIPAAQQETNADDLFGQSVAAELKEMDAEKKKIVKRKINEILYS